MWLFEGFCVILSTDLFLVGLFGLNKTVPGAHSPHRSGSSSWNINTSACATAVDGPKLNSTIDAVILEGMRADEKRIRFLCPFKTELEQKTGQNKTKARESTCQPQFVSSSENRDLRSAWLRKPVRDPPCLESHVRHRLLRHIKLRLLWALLCIVTQMGQNETITFTALRLPHL